MSIQKPLTGHAVDDYVNRLKSILESNPVDGADLLSQLQAYDTSLQSNRVKQALNLYAAVRLSSTQDVALIDDAVSQL